MIPKKEMRGERKNMKRNEIFVENLCLEVTRRCNMGCAHCLRGNAEDLDMSHETIEQVLGQVDVIGQVTFTGGEPSLNVDAIGTFLHGQGNTGNCRALSLSQPTGKRIRKSWP